MKILFVCWANVGRSQMAAALYNQQADSNAAYSAGTQVDIDGETLIERKNRIGGTYAIDVMDTVGVDVRNNRRTQLTQEMLDNYDRVISMAQKEYTPEWLSQHPKYLYWDVKDPGMRGYQATEKAFYIIQDKLQSLHS